MTRPYGGGIWQRISAVSDDIGDLRTDMDSEFKRVDAHLMALDARIVELSSMFEGFMDKCSEQFKQLFDDIELLSKAEQLPESKSVTKKKKS